MVFTAHIKVGFMYYVIYVHILQQPITKLCAVTLLIAGLFLRPPWKDVVILKTTEISPVTSKFILLHLFNHRPKHTNHCMPSCA